MRNDELDSIWMEIERHNSSQSSSYQRMVYANLLYRAYIGSTGIPPRRFLSLEIPVEEKEQFEAITVPLGFSLSITEPGIKHEGYVACVLQSTSSDQNDMFTIVTKDILDNLCKQASANEYTGAMQSRIEKWMQFFRNPVGKKLSEDSVIGLIGELSFILSLADYEVDCGTDLWNGPNRAAQDFQGETVAIEVKTTSTKKIENVQISSEEQLDYSSYESLFLVVYRVERNDVAGIKLPELIARVESRLNERQKALFKARLLCLGYADEDAEKYQSGYKVKEMQVYSVENGFPALLPRDLRQGVTDVKYKISLSCCDSFISDMPSIIKAIKEYEYGEDGGTC